MLAPGDSRRVTLSLPPAKARDAGPLRGWLSIHERGDGAGPVSGLLQRVIRDRADGGGAVANHARLIRTEMANPGLAGANWVRVHEEGD